ncbi:putative sugar transporter [Neolentinus lepideus HHB14362 ss-1]|uniref:Putative sugar transporter n=1 Tax=Neolentinus lepideus HHB14362 ss-1 TaxID=1314782 RepID=A0A165R659_9AGAM|nr:putative sugar transporter [Neolentinus lepideus HHB14362 ss-1]
MTATNQQIKSYGLRGKPLLYIITFCCSLGFLLFGYDNGVFSGLTTDPLFLAQLNHPSATLLGFIVAVYELGCLFGALGCAFWGERFGRKTICAWGAAVLVVGTVIQSASYGRPEMIAGRIVTGLGMGLITSVVPIYQSETTPAASRGRMIAVQLSMLIVGIVIAYWIDYGMSLKNSSVQWRFPIAFQVIFAFLLIAMCAVLPESPRWLASHGFTDEALSVLCSLRYAPAESPNVRAEFADIQHAIALESSESGSWKDVFTDGGIMGWQRTAIACAVQAMQQFTGTNIITYYAPYVMENSVGLNRHQSLLLSGGLQLFFLVMSFIPWFILDRVGRRRLFIFGSWGMGSCMLVSGILIKIGGRYNGTGAVVMLYLFQGFFTIGWMSNMWCYPSEILPLRNRQRGGALSVVFQWLTTFLVVEITPPALSDIGWKTYVIFAVFNWVSIGVAWRWFPETAGRTLESIDFLFAGAKNMREVVERSKEREGAQEGFAGAPEEKTPGVEAKKTIEQVE